MTNYVWKGDNGTSSAPSGGFFDTGADWSPGGVPGVGDTASFAKGAYQVVSDNTEDDEVNSVSIGSQVTLETLDYFILDGNAGTYGSNAGTIQIDAGSQFSLSNVYNVSTFSNSGTITEYGKMNFLFVTFGGGTSGIINNTGLISLVDQRSTNINASQPEWILDGKIEFSGNGSVALDHALMSHVLATGILQNDSNTFYGSGTIGDATFILTNGAAGTIDANAIDPLTIDAGLGVTNGGVLEATSGATLIDQSTTTNTGNIDAYDGTVDLNGTVTNAGGLVAASGDQQLALLEIRGTVTNTGTIGAYDDGNVDITGSVSGGTITAQRDGVLTVEGSIVNSSATAIDGGELDSSGTASAISFSTGDDSSMMLGGSVDGSTITAAGGNDHGSGIYVSGAVTDSTLSVDAGNNVLQISGTVTDSSLTMTNGGAITIANGTLDTDTANGAILVEDKEATVNGQTAYSSNSLTIAGSLTGGSVTLDGTEEQAMLLAGSAVTTLASGEVILTDGGENVIGASQRGNLLVNKELIDGNGQLGDGLLQLDNQGTVNATGNSPLYVETTTSAVSLNNGVMESTGGGTLEFVRGGVTNIGTIDAGAGSNVYFDRSVVPTNLSAGVLSGGTWEADAGGVISIAGTAITTDAATILLIGTGASLEAGSGTAARTIEQSLTTIAAAGSLTESGRSDSFANALSVQGALSAVNGTLTFATTNLVGGTLTGGLWSDTASGTTILNGGPIVTIAASVGLMGMNGRSELETSSGGTTTTFESSLTTIAAGGSLNVAFQNETFANALTVAGTLSFYSATITSGPITATATSTITGLGSIAASINDAGTVMCGSFGLNFSGASNTFSGLIQGGTLGLTAGATTIAQGATLGMARWSISGSATKVTIAETLTYAGSLGEGAGSAITIASGDTVILSGAASLSGAVVLSAGTTVSQTTLAIAGDLAGSGATITLDAHTSVSLAGAVGSGETIAFSGIGSALLLGKPGSFAGTITGFATSDAIDLAGEQVTAVTHTSSAVTVTLAGGTTQTLALTGSYAGLAIESDGAGGSYLVATSASPVTLPSGSDYVAFAASSTGNVVKATTATLNAGDHLWGNGADTIQVTGGGTLNLAALAHLGGFSAIKLDDNNYAITLADADVAAGATLTVNAGTLSSTKTLSFDGSAERDGAFRITGEAGADTLKGGSGADIFNGEGGADTMIGGAGNDTYYVDNAGDVVTEAVNAGTDTVHSTINYTLPANVENLILDGTANINGGGNTLANTLTGNAGNNILDGGTGADTMTGGAGDDTYYVDNVGDKVIEAADGGTDSVHSSISYTLAANVENLMLTGTAAINGTGNGLDNTIVGNTGANVIDGGTGYNHLTGGGGADTFQFDTAPGNGNMSLISDFTVGQDKIALSKAIYKALGADGALAPGAFYAGTAAHAASDRIIYDKTTGNLFYDADGSGPGGELRFAQVKAGTNLSASDFTVFETGAAATQNATAANAASSKSKGTSAVPSSGVTTEPALHNFVSAMASFGGRTSPMFEAHSSRFGGGDMHRMLAYARV